MSDAFQDSTPHQSPFEAIRREDEDGAEYWSARDLTDVLGYTNWRNFVYAINKAKEACAQSGYDIADHFDAGIKMVAVGSQAQRPVEDVHLSRYACYLIVQNADPAKPIVALGQTYFAIQTRRQELSDQIAALPESESERRLVLRAQVAEHNLHLADAARGAGVLEPRDFAIFQDHGYMGLYGGLRAKDIHARKELKPKDHILDHMGSEELAANYFRATQTEQKLRREQIEGKAAANATHFEVGREVRQTIQRLGGTPPEDLPTPPESIRQLQQQRAQPQLLSEGDEEG